MNIKNQKKSQSQLSQRNKKTLVNPRKIRRNANGNKNDWKPLKLPYEVRTECGTNCLPSLLQLFQLHMHQSKTVILLHSLSLQTLHFTPILLRLAIMCI